MDSPLRDMEYIEGYMKKYLEEHLGIEHLSFTYFDSPKDTATMNAGFIKDGGILVGRKNFNTTHYIPSVGVTFIKGGKKYGLKIPAKQLVKRRDFYFTSNDYLGFKDKYEGYEFVLDREKALETIREKISAVNK